MLEPYLRDREILQTGERESGAGAESDLGRAGKEGLRRRHVGARRVRGRDLLLDHGDLGIFADRDDAARQNGRSR